MTEFYVDNCPDDNVLAEFVEGKLLDSEHETVFLHIANCSRCRDLVAFAAKELAKQKAGKKVSLGVRTRNMIAGKIADLRHNNVSEMIIAAWDDFVKKVVPVFDRLENAEVIAASEVNSVITFSSVSNMPGQKWKMQLFIPNQLGKTLDVAVDVPEVSNCNGKLILCGNAVEIKSGRGAVNYEMLRKSFKNPEVAFVFETGERVAGYPEL